MNDAERIQALNDRIDTILERVPDNPLYEDHESRSVLNYIQCIRILKEKEAKETWRTPSA